MKEFDQKEYQTVVLAALLHDIGKLLHRGREEYIGKHEQASAKFVVDYHNRFENEDFYDLELARILIEHHHSTKGETLEEAYFRNLIEAEKERKWQLFKILKRADSYSCAERDREQQWKRDVDKRRAPLDSIFSVVSLETKNQEAKSRYGYPLNQLVPSKSFPESFTALSEEEITEHITTFCNSIPNFSSFRSFDDILNTWLDLLERYTWAVPSDTRYEISDVSLYDHLRSSAAIAACLYKRHAAAIEIGENLDRRYEFILIGGDFSGIQDFIFDITNRGSGGAAKRLRARSLFISLFSEVTIHRILHALQLPLVCSIFSAGGKFLLLAPDIHGISELLQTVKGEIEEEIHRTYFSQFSFLMSWMNIKGFKEEFQTYSFFKTADEMFRRLETEKIMKARGVLINQTTGSWDVEAFKADSFYAQYTDTGDCKICGKGPALFEDKDQDTGESTMCCFICFRDKFTIGQKVPKSKYVAFGRACSIESDDEIRIALMSSRSKGNKEKAGYYARLLKDYEDNDEYYLIYDIGSSRGIKILEKHKHPLTKYIANHIPVQSDGNALSFEEISKFSIWQRDGRAYGSDLLGVLKADIDNLGLIFSKGFENPRRAEAKLPEIDRKTVSRFLTMSRMLELFFSGWMKETLSKCQNAEIARQLNGIEYMDRERFTGYLLNGQLNFQSIYTVYSGGDDLVLVGPWETMIIFSLFLNMQFRKYTCANRSITLSAGLTFIKPRHPIASAINQADEFLTTSKELGKNRITFFGTTTEWDHFPGLINFFLLLNEKLNEDNSKINRSFLYRLLEYHQMALRYVEERDIPSLKYLSAMNYDIGRNIIKRNKAGQIIEGLEELEMLQPLITEKPDDESLMYYLKIPLFWALYRNRRASTDKIVNDS